MDEIGYPFTNLTASLKLGNGQVFQSYTDALVLLNRAIATEGSAIETTSTEHI